MVPDDSAAHPLMNTVSVALLFAVAIVAAQGHNREHVADNEEAFVAAPGDGIDVTRLPSSLPPAVAAGSDATALARTAQASNTPLQTANIASEEPIIVRRLDAWGE